MKNVISKFKVTDGSKFSMRDFETDYSAGYKKEDSKALLDEIVQEIADLQSALYAQNRYALLILFQAMDAAGKDGAIAHSLSGLNPEGCEVYSFKQPSIEELDHDFLWRHYKALPQLGRIGVHNRSHYENVLITKVHPEILIKQQIASIKSLDDVDHKFWEHRYESIKDFEKHLSYNGTVMIKFFLHVSKDEQKERFLKRIDDPKKNWKFSSADITERGFWDDYMKAYEKAIKKTATKECPWYVIPADKKWFSRIAISLIILETLKNLKIKYPVLPKEEKDKLEEAKNTLLENS